MQSTVFRGYFILLLTALLWGTAFIFQKNSTDHVDALTFNFLRFGVAVPALLLLYFLPKKLFQPSAEDILVNKKTRHSSWFIGMGAGVFMFVGISLQQWGLEFTTVGKSGFLTSLYIILVPILALFVGQRCRIEVWLGAVLTIAGVYLLNSHGGGESAESQFNRGDVMTLVCSLAWALQVLWLSLLVRYANVLDIAIIQMLTVSVLSGIGMIFLWMTQTVSILNWEIVWAIRYDIFYTGVISAAVAFTLQIFGQRYVPATNAALIMSTEAVFAMLAGALFLGEIITLGSFLGCSLILAGIVFAQLQGKVFSKR